MSFKEVLFTITDWLEANPWLIFLGVLMIAGDYAICLIRVFHNKPSLDNTLVYYFKDGRGHVCKCDIWYVKKLKKYFVLPDIYRMDFNAEAQFIGDLEKHGRDINEYFRGNSGTDSLSHSGS